jgi:hypothetical protein
MAEQEKHEKGKKELEGSLRIFVLTPCHYPVDRMATIG